MDTSVVIVLSLVFTLASQDATSIDPARLVQLTAAHGLLIGAQETLDDGNYPGAREQLAQAQEALGALGPPFEADLAEMWILASGLGRDSQAPQLQEVALEWLLAHGREVRGDGDEEHYSFMLNLGAVRHAQRDPEGARDCFKQVLDGLEGNVADDHFLLLTARQNLAGMLVMLGDYDEALEAFERLVETFQAHHPPEEPGRLAAEENFASVLKFLDRTAPAAARYREVLAVRERMHPPGHPALMRVQLNLAMCLPELGEVAEAERLLALVLEGQALVYPPGDPALEQGLLAYAGLLIDLKRFEEAVPIVEEIVAKRRGRLAEDDYERLFAEGQLLTLLTETRDLERARDLGERLLAVRLAAHGEDHPRVRLTRANLSLVLQLQGDAAGAWRLFEKAYESFERQTDVDEPKFQEMRAGYASLIAEAGQLDRGIEILRALVADRQATHEPGHPDLIEDESRLAVLLARRGDLGDARVMLEDLVRRTEDSLGADHWLMADLRDDLAVVLSRQGEIEASLAMRRDVLDTWLQRLPEGDRSRLGCRRNLALSLIRLGKTEEAVEHVRTLLAESLTRLQTGDALADRERRELAAEMSEQVPGLMWLVRKVAGDDELEAELFDLVATLRALSVRGPRLARRVAQDDALRRLAIDAADARRQVQSLVLRGPSGVDDASYEESLASRIAERDGHDRALRQRLATLGVGLMPVTSEALAAAVGPRAAIVSYHRVLLYDEHPAPDAPRHDALVALVLRGDGSVLRVDLGPAEALEQLAVDWRASINRPLGATRGGPLGGDSKPRGPKSGVKLREAVLDPVLTLAGDVDTLHVQLDGFLHLVPLDALPDRDGVVGDRIAVRTEASLQRLVEPAAGSPDTPKLLAVGGVEYDEDPASSEVASVLDGVSTRIRGRRATASAAPPLRFGDHPFEELKGSSEEVVWLAGFFKDTFDREAVLLTGVNAGKSALRAAVAGRTHLHIATHGWFAPDSVRSWADAPAAASFEPLAFISGFAPMALCGLALTGANRGRDASGNVRGILTAEELAGFDLTACDLAVLSACETGVGAVGRAGQGVESLQSALHAAGVNTGLTSLWSVNDEATRLFMEAFYSALWNDGLGKADALWTAKSAMREAGQPAEHWAGWVLTGAPE